jgi:hypothetical protein
MIKEINEEILQCAYTNKGRLCVVSYRHPTSRVYLILKNKSLILVPLYIKSRQTHGVPIEISSS